MKISKNLKRGDVVTSLQELMDLAKEGKSVCFLSTTWNAEKKLMVKPASFLINWPLRRVIDMTIFKTERL